MGSVFFDIHNILFPPLTAEDPGLPSWLRCLIACCCEVDDFDIQSTSVATLLDLINLTLSVSSGTSGATSGVTVIPILTFQEVVIIEQSNIYQVCLHLGCFFFKCLLQQTFNVVVCKFNVVVCKYVVGCWVTVVVILVTVVMVILVVSMVLTVVSSMCNLSLSSQSMQLNG